MFDVRSRSVFGNFDWALLLAVTLLCGTGLVVLYSAGYDAEAEKSMQMEKQAYSMLVGFAVYMVCTFFNTVFWRRWAYLIFVGGCVLLGIVLTKGYLAKGATRWLEIGGFRMQPSEFLKFGLILALARILSDEEAPRDGYTIKDLLFPIAVVGVPMGLILVQPDLGTALSVGLIAGSMILLAGVRAKTLAILFGGFAIMVIPAWSFLKEYQKRRILTFISPESDPLGSGYHAIQSKIAVGSGMLTGKGFLQGTQTQLRFLPEQTTDFIFSVLAEEWGFLGTCFVLALYLYILMHVLKVVVKCSDPFPAYVAFGAGAMVFWHVVMNIGMVIGVLPVVGVTLPFLSYGGSSVVGMLAGLGLVAGIYRRRFLFASSRFAR